MLDRHTVIDVLIVRVLENMVDTPFADGETQSEVRQVVSGTRRALLAAMPAASDSPQIVPVLTQVLRHARCPVLITPGRG